VVAAEAGQDRPGRVALVGAGPGDPRLLTVAAQELLWQADVVMHDALVSPETIAQSGPGARLVDVGKRAGRANPEQGQHSAVVAGHQASTDPRGGARAHRGQDAALEDRQRLS